MVSDINEIVCDHFARNELISVTAHICKDDYATFQEGNDLELRAAYQDHAPPPVPGRPCGETYGARREALELTTDQHADLKEHREAQDVAAFDEDRGGGDDLVIYACASGCPAAFDDLRLREVERLWESYEGRAKRSAFPDITSASPATSQRLLSPRSLSGDALRSIASGKARTTQPRVGPTWRVTRSMSRRR